MKILIVDDHPLVRKGLTSVLSFEEDIGEIKEASNVEEAMAFLTKGYLDVAIIDLNLDKEDGLEIVRCAKEKNLSTKFIILTSSIRKEDFFRARDAEVDGYILKHAFTEDIIYAFHVIARGKKFFDPEILQYESEQLKNSNLRELTDREKDVLMELGKGLSNVKIAENLFISEHTVKKHISNILSKLDLSHRTEAALLVNNSINLWH
jgi:DNA-binding NarL/FixJ family response regulator